MVERSITKSQKELYNNQSCDLVDKVSKSIDAIAEVTEMTLPAPLKGKSLELKKMIILVKTQRDVI